MKSVKFVLVAAAAFVGLSSAIASTNRTTFIYAQKSANVYVKLASYDPINCVTPTALPCVFTVATDKGATTTKATLTAAGAQPHGLNRLYLGI